MKKARLFGNCTRKQSFDISEVMDAAKEIPYEKFIKNVSTDDFNELAKKLGYYVGKGRDGLKLKDDWHVRFYSYRNGNKYMWIMRQSSIEYFFKKD